MCLLIKSLFFFFQSIKPEIKSATIDYIRGKETEDKYLNQAQASGLRVEKVKNKFLDAFGDIDFLYYQPNSQRAVGLQVKSVSVTVSL